MSSYESENSYISLLNFHEKKRFNDFQKEEEKVRIEKKSRLELLEARCTKRKRNLSNERSKIDEYISQDNSLILVCFY